MNKKLLSFALALSLVGSNYAAVVTQPKTEQEKIAQLKSLIKTAC